MVPQKCLYMCQTNISLRQILREINYLFQQMEKIIIQLHKLAFNTYSSFLLQGTSEYLIFAAISKLIAAAVTYPYQVIRARLQDHHHTYEGAWDCMKKTWRYERLLGFYKGLVPYLVHVTPNICLVMLIWENFTK